MADVDLCTEVPVPDRPIAEDPWTARCVRAMYGGDSAKAYRCRAARECASWGDMGALDWWCGALCSPEVERRIAELAREFGEVTDGR